LVDAVGSDPPYLDAALVDDVPWRLWFATAPALIRPLSSAECFLCAWITLASRIIKEEGWLVVICGD